MEPPQHGGKLLGSGVHGCTFEPAPRCAGGNVFKTIHGLPAVGKIVDEDVTSELRFGRKLMSLPLAHLYFAVPATECRPQEPIADPDVRRCDLIQDAREPLRMLIMPAAGKPIDIWGMENRGRLATHFRRIFVHLLEGAVIYQRAGIIHNDIHKGNVLVDALGVARYIDFGVSFQLSEVRSWSDTGMRRTFPPQYALHAPEVYAARMLMSGVDAATGVRRLKMMNPIYDQMERMFAPRETLLAAVLSAQSFLRQHGEATFIHRYAKQFDAWRIGLLFWYMWYDLLSWSGFRDSSVYRDRSMYRRVIGGLTEFHPQKRLTVGAALRLLDPTNRLAEDY